MRNSISIALRVFVVTFVVLGLGYPLVVTGLARLIFPERAGGSLITDRRGVVVGSELIGQRFDSDAYFRPRPSAGDYDPMASGGSNLGPTSLELASNLAARSAGTGLGRDIPADMITASASGLDPHISPANAYAQAARVARARGIAAESVRHLVRGSILERDLGFIGEPRVNVLRLNLELDAAFGER